MVARKPGSVRLRAAIIPLEPALPLVSSSNPWTRAGSPQASTVCLAPDGVYRAAGVTVCAVSSYLTISPLPLRAVCFLLHFP